MSEPQAAVSTYDAGGSSVASTGHFVQLRLVEVMVAKGVLTAAEAKRIATQAAVDARSLGTVDGNAAAEFAARIAATW